MARTDTSMSTRTAPERSAAEYAAMGVGAIFILVGILGFVPGITQNFDRLEFAGHESGAELLGLFQVSILHNIVHLLFGVAGLAAAKSIASARTFLIGGGLIYGGLAAYGLLVDQMSNANFVPVNDADNGLHLGLSIGMIALGLLLSAGTADRADTPRTASRL